MILPKNPRKMYSTMRELLHEKLGTYFYYPWTIIVEISQQLLVRWIIFIRAESTLEKRDLVFCKEQTILCSAF